MSFNDNIHLILREYLPARGRKIAGAGGGST